MTVVSLPGAIWVRSNVKRAFASEFVRHSALVFAATMVGNVLNYLFNFALSRRLGVEGFAALSSIASGLMIFALPGTVLNLVVVKHSGELRAHGSCVWHFAQRLLKGGFVAGLALFALGLLLRASLAAFLHIPNDSTMVLAVAIVAASVVTPGVRGVLQAEQDFLFFSLSVVLEVFVKFALGVALVYAGFGVTGAILGWLLGTLCGLAFAAFAVQNHRTGDTGSEATRLDVVRIVKSVGAVAAATSLLTLMSFLDVILVKHFFDAHQAGLYAAVNLTGKIILFVVSFVPMVLLPKVVAAANDRPRARRLLLQASGITIAMTSVALAFAALAPTILIRLVAGRAFLAASPYVFEYDFALAVLSIITLVVNYRIALHRFAFVAPLAAVMFCEAAAIAMNHSTLWSVIHILLIGNLCALAVCMLPDRIKASGVVQAVSQWS